MVFLCVFLFIAMSAVAQVANQSVTNISLAVGEKVWAGIIVEANIMPLKQGYCVFQFEK